MCGLVSDQSWEARASTRPAEFEQASGRRRVRDHRGEIRLRRGLAVDQRFARDLAPGRALLEELDPIGRAPSELHCALPCFEKLAVGHRDLDQMIGVVRFFLHEWSPCACWFPTSPGKRGPLHGPRNLSKPQAAGGSAIIAVKFACAATLPSINALPANLHTVARFWTNSTSSLSSTPGSTGARNFARSEEHTSELQSLMRISYAVFCLKKKKNINKRNTIKMYIVEINYIRTQPIRKY